MVLAALAGLVLIVASGCTPAGDKKIELKDLRDKVSYSIGMNIGADFKRQGIDLDPDLIAQAIKDVIKGAPLLLTEAQVKEAITAYQKELEVKMEAKAKADLEKNAKEGAAFLAENGKKEGVKTLASGLQYKVLTPGTGKKPSAADTVSVHYRGTLIDGTEFDSSFKRNEPATFPVSGVIPGWTEALQLMEEGAKWQLVIPAALAYGERGAGQQIGPNSTLIFEVELLKVQ
ncbi:MAG: hypothetical protein A2091_06040 [Desulfuromonadales bacterium GWD2_61_12]|nr:MAG: hypothetical protein A2005_07410 [Desulfuromonadales bacterium GWC2_61_20]OGR36421.1 MAG: hypothetical protein A2091_06040 [Desulfuromonadales bacterium GWD2_61_12]HAD03117.1 hypothetical protein [Desulfuromonas sp.]HBT83801.1 hypothetical protein [Desulfuromonas sp.]